MQPNCPHYLFLRKQNHCHSQHSATSVICHKLPLAAWRSAMGASHAKLLLGLACLAIATLVASLSLQVHTNGMRDNSSCCNRSQAATFLWEPGPANIATKHVPFVESDREQSFFDAVHINEEHNLMYCSIPKNGCTAWKRTFSTFSPTAPGTTSRCAQMAPLKCTHFKPHFEPPAAV